MANTKEIKDRIKSVRDTQKITKKIREEILPEMVRNMQQLNHGLDVSEENDMNPDWGSLSPEFDEKIKQMNEMITEGSDVYMSTFSLMKQYPFFNVTAHWFLPYYRQHSLVASASNGEPQTEEFIDLILRSSGICDNDSKTGASWDMMREAVRYLYEHEDQEFTFTGTLQAKWARDNWLAIGGRLKVGGYVLFSDTQFAPDGVLIRITGIKEFLTAPYSITLEISNSTQGGGFSSTMRNLEGLEVVIDDTKQQLVQYTKRRFRDAQETMSMLENSLLDYANSINPITVQTMTALIGDESLQFRFIRSRDNATVVDNVVNYDASIRVLNCAASYLQHMTLGINMSSTHALSEYKIWKMQSYMSPPLDDAGQAYNERRKQQSASWNYSTKNYFSNTFSIRRINK